MSSLSFAAHTALEVADLSVDIDAEAGVVSAVQNLALAIRRGETFALVGESGCGKSMTALALLRLLPEAGRIVSGDIRLGDTRVLELPEVAMRSVRGGEMAMVFQEPANSLNPVVSIGRQILESIQAHTGLRGAKAREKAIYWLERVGISDASRRLNDYPFQFSGGQKQRIMIAIALAGEPQVLLADEPTTALDVTVQAQILDLLADIQSEMGLAILLITHDLAVVEKVANYVALMRHGKIVESSTASRFFSAPDHPYARELLAAIPSFAKRGQSLVPGPAGQPGRLSKAEVPEVVAPVLCVDNLSVSYRIGARLLRQGQLNPVVQSLSFDLKPGETLALLGESGCGKTTTAKALLQLLDKRAVVEGRAMLGDISLLDATGRALRRARQQVQIVFQDPYSSLNPRMLVGDILDEGISALKSELDVAARQKIVASLLDRVGLPANTAQRYPHEFSGGQRQRIAIARALAVEPRVLICDEPTSALDVSVQAQILELLQTLQYEFGVAYLFITHNFGVVEYLADRIAIMHEGRIVELGTADQVLHHPGHAETQRLLAAVPRLEAIPYNQRSGA